MAQDDNPLYVIRRDLSGGVNDRQYENVIGETQATVMTNVDIGTPGMTKKRLGSVRSGGSISATSFAHIYTYPRQGYTDVIVGYHDTVLREWLGTGNWTLISGSSFTASLTDIGIVAVKESGLVPDDVIIIQNGTDNATRYHKSSSNVWTSEDMLNTSNSPPITTVMCWDKNRLLCLKDDLLYYSEAYPASFASAFDRTTNSFRIPVGAERGLTVTRDLGVIVMGANAIWCVQLSATPSAVTDFPQPLVTEHGVVSKRGWCVAGDDIYYFAKDGFRALKRTIQDKLQAGVSYPISYNLKSYYEDIDWSVISRLAMVYFDNKIFISVPVSTTVFKTWIYYPASDSFTVLDGWSPLAWAKYKVSGQENLYYSKYGDGKMFRAWYGYTDEGSTTTDGTAITMTEEGRQEDFQKPLQRKVGGDVEVIAVTESSGSLGVHLSLDNNDYQPLGTIDMESTTPTLPISLPFDLGNISKVSGKFHIDNLGAFKTAKLKLVESSSNTGEIKILERNIVTYPEEYQFD